MIYPESVIDLMGDPSDVLGEVIMKEDKILAGMVRFPHFSDTFAHQLRVKAVNAYRSLIQQIRYNAGERELLLVGLLRGGFTTTLLVRDILSTSMKKHIPILLLPTYRDISKPGQTAISTKSMELLLSKYPQARLIYLIDGWTGTGQSITSTEKCLSTYLKKRKHHADIKTAALLDIQSITDIYGSADDFTLLHSLNYHSALGIHIYPSIDDAILPRVEILPMSPHIHTELSLVQKLLTNSTDKVRSHRSSSYTYSKKELEFFRKNRVGLGINEAFHRYYRERQLVCVPIELWNTDMKSLLEQVGITDYQIVKNSRSKQLYSVKPSLFDATTIQ